jgi:hypothetical protein
VTSSSLIALASVLTALGATAAAVVAAYALRAQQRGQQRQHDLENLRWIIGEWARLGDMRRRAASGLLAGTEDLYALREVLNFHENCSFIVREGFITESTFTATVGGLALIGWWHSAESFIENVRASTGNAHVFEHLEWLKDRLETEPFDPNGRRLQEFLRRESDTPLVGAVADNEV